MFGFKKNNRISTIVIDGSDVISDDQQITTAVWQQRHVPSNIGTILAKAINATDDTVDAALAAYIHIHGMSMPLYEPYHRILFNRQSGISGNIWHNGADYHVTIKGMPERILDHCDMSENERESITTQLHTMSASGAVIIAVATGMLQHSIKNLDGLKKNEKLSFVGFAILQVNISSEARQLCAKAIASNISLYICTGQHQAAAYHLAQQLGVATIPSDVFDAQRLDIMSADEIQKVISSKKVFSRCMPQHKKHIISAINAFDPSVKTASTLEDFKKLLAK